MHILLMAQCYLPEDVSAAILISELATDLVKQGHQVSIVTGAPSYPYGRVFQGYRNSAYQTEWLEGVRVIRTWSYISPRKTFWRRLLHYGSYSATAFYGGLLAGKPDVLVSFSPPLTLGMSAWLLSVLWGVPWVLQLEDLYPDAAVAAGMLDNKAAVAFFSAMESFLYRHATHISLISEGFRRNLIDKGVPPEKISLIPVWADPDLVSPLPKENSFRRQHGLAGQCVVMYSGNLGLTSSLEDVLGAAELLNGALDVSFAIIGEGVKKSALEDLAKKAGLKNIQFLPYQPREQFAEMLAAADLGLVTLNEKSAASSLPSKTFNIMASARPIVAVAPPESELAHLVQEAKCGVVVPPGHPQRLACEIQELRQHPEQRASMGQNGRAMLESHFSRAKCISNFEALLAGLFEYESAY